MFYVVIGAWNPQGEDYHVHNTCMGICFTRNTLIKILDILVNAVQNYTVNQTLPGTSKFSGRHSWLNWLPMSDLSRKVFS